MTNAIILAAGLGSRLSPLTKDKPKSLIEFGKKTLLERIVEIFRKYGIDDISIVTGYKKEKINLPNITYFENKNYLENSTLSSLFCAQKKISESTIITYSDIIFQENILEKLLNVDYDISAVVDRKWIDYWKFRTGESIHDATETAKFQEIYFKTRQNCINNKNELNKNLSFEKLRIVDLLQGLIKMNCPVHSILTDNGWLEFDTINDYELYSDMYNKNILSKLIQLSS